MYVWFKNYKPKTDPIQHEKPLKKFQNTDVEPDDDKDETMTDV